MCTALHRRPLLRQNTAERRILLAQQTVQELPDAQVSFHMDQFKCAIWDAAQSGTAEEVRSLLGAVRGLYPPACLAGALGVAAANDRTDVVRLLLDFKASVNLVSEDRGFTPLTRAATWNSLSVLDVLLQAKADVHQCDRGKSIPHWATTRDNTALSRAIFHEHVHVAEALLRANACPNTRGWKGGSEDGTCRMTPLCLAANVAGNLAMVQALIHAKASIRRAPVDAGRACVTTAARWPDNCAVLTALISAKASVNEVHEWKDTSPLRVAVEQGHGAGSTLLYLLRARADVRARDRTGYVPLASAASQGDVDAVRHLLVADSTAATLEARTNRRRTPLILAACNAREIPSCVQVAELLLAAKASVDAGDGHTALDYARRRGPDSLVHILLEAKAQPSSARSSATHSCDDSDGVEIAD